MPPDPETECRRHSFIVTVMARDHVGVMASITRSIRELHGAIRELSQTVMRGYFTIILAASLPEDVGADALRRRIETDGAAFSLAAHARPWETGDADRSEPLAQAGRYILTAQGADRAEIIPRMTSYLADQGINIEDFYARVDEGVLTMVAQIQVDGGKSATEVRRGIQQMGEETGLGAHLLHENIFRVTSEVGAVRRLARRLGEQG